MKWGIKMDYVKLSKIISYALRHAPWEYELEMDENGYVSVNQLLFALKEENKWRSITEDDIRKVVATSDKGRFEIVDGNIRALYGHSFKQKIIREAGIPPEMLYHGTSHAVVPLILKSGLLPKGRQYVHLAVDPEMAVQVGKRRDIEPVLLTIDVRRALEDGVAFYKGNDKVWLADFVDPKYICLQANDSKDQIPSFNIGI